MSQNDFSDVAQHFSNLISCLVQHGMTQSVTVNMLPAALDINDAAKYIGVSRSKLYELKDSGKIKPPVDNDGKKVYLRKDLDAYLKSLKE